MNNLREMLAGYDEEGLVDETRFVDAARQILTPITDEEVERSMDASNQVAESDATAFDCWKAGLEAFIRERFGI